MNRAVAILGMTFGGVLSGAVLVAGALVLAPRGIQVERYEQIALVLVEPFAWWGFFLFVASLGVACFGAALEIALSLAYVLAQGFGWNWGENRPPAEAPRFSLAYTLIILLATAITALGVDPLQLTMVAMALTSAILPLVTLPFLVLMNDPAYVGTHRNGWIGNGVVVAVIALTFVLAVVSIPLEILGG